MKLTIHKQSNVRVPRSRLIKIFEAVIEEEAEPERQSRINLVFTDDEYIKTLNEQYRSIDKATDVLSFNIDTSLDKNATFGEIYISTETSRKQAHEQGTTVNDEIVRLFLHGLLHLFGYDHAIEVEGRLMRSREDHFLEFSEGVS